MKFFVIYDKSNITPQLKEDIGSRILVLKLFLLFA